MTKLVTLLLWAVCGFLGYWLTLAYLQHGSPFIAKSEEVSKYAIIHKKNECPSGWITRPRYFQEEDGTTQDACFNPNFSGFVIDYLLPGESVTVPSWK